MKVKFDSLNRFEIPQFYVCSPGSVYQNGLLTNVIGALSDTSDEELVINFNTTSELNFRIHLVPRDDPDENQYIFTLYKSLQNRRMIFLDDIGFFVITSVKDGYSDGKNYKDVQAESCEYEIGNKVLPYIEDGTYQFIDLLESIVSVLPLWKIGTVAGDIAEKYRTFEDISPDRNALAFLLEDMQDAYECIFVFDTVQRLIHVYDQNNYVLQTSIHITKDDVINSLEITENSEDLYTAISVQGEENLNISPVNPIGTNVIYDFTYYLDWMTPALKERVSAWMGLVHSKEQEYYDLNLEYYENLTTQSNLKSKVEQINTQLDMYQRCRDNVVAQGATTSVESYNEEIVKNGGVPVGIQNEVSDTVSEIDGLITDAQTELASVEAELDTVSVETERLFADIKAIHDEVSITDYFSEAEYAELSNYIFEGNYTDEYITITSSMTYSERFGQMKTLYDRAVGRLSRVSEPTQEFSIDVENFLFVKEFEQLSEQLEAGCLINVELGSDNIAMLFLSNITVNYDDKSLSMTFGNRFNRFDPKAMFNNVLGDIKKSANSINYVKEILYPVKNGEFSAMKEAIESSGILTKNAALASSNQEIIIDDTGILGRKLLDTGEYDPRQIKITNQTIVFTEDGWDTSSTALGGFYFNNPFTNETEEHYGIIAKTLIGNMLLSETAGIFNTSNSVTINESGVILTSNSARSNPEDEIFKIRKAQTDENGNEFYTDLLYIDDDGNLVLNGTISVFTSGGGSTSLESISANDGVTMDDVNDAVTNMSNSINDSVDDKLSEMNKSTTDQINTMSRELESKYQSMIDGVEGQLNDYKADMGQYFQFDDNGMSLGATESEFKTVIDNRGMYFKQGDSVVSYVNNNQLYIQNAVINNTLILGSFFFCPREDGGVSLTWQE